MGVEPFLIMSSLILVVGQRLARVPCSKCSEPVEADPRTLELLGLDPGQIDASGLRKGPGCGFCAQTGYQGRLGLFEVVRVTRRMQELIVARATEVAVKEEAVASGMRSMRADGLAKALAGRTTLEEVLRVTPPDPDLVRRATRRAGPAVEPPGQVAPPPKTPPRCWSWTTTWRSPRSRRPCWSTATRSWPPARSRRACAWSAPSTPTWSWSTSTCPASTSSSCWPACARRPWRTCPSWSCRPATTATPATAPPPPEPPASSPSPSARPSSAARSPPSSRTIQSSPDPAQALLGGRGGSELPPHGSGTAGGKPLQAGVVPGLREAEVAGVLVVDRAGAGRAVPAGLQGGAAGGVAQALGVGGAGAVGAPLGEQAQRPGELAAGRRQLIGEPRRAARVGLADQHGLALQVLEALGQDVGGDAREGLEQLVE